MLQTIEGQRLHSVALKWFLEESMIRHLLTTVLKAEFLSDPLLSSVMIKPSTAIVLKLTIKHLAHQLLKMLFSL